MANKQDIILTLLTKIDNKSDKHGEKLAGIEEHLSTLNSKVVKNVHDIEMNRDEVVTVKNKLYKAGTIGFVCWSVFMVIVNIDKFINFFSNTI